MDRPVLDTLVAAWREDGVWSAASLASDVAESMETLLEALRRFPGEVGVLGLLAAQDEFFMIVRVRGKAVQAMVSDAMCVVDWPIVEDAMDWADVPWLESELVEFEALGDLAICADLGVSADELRMLCADDDTYPDEQLRSVVDRIGLGKAFSDAVDA